MSGGPRPQQLASLACRSDGGTCQDSSRSLSHGPMSDVGALATRESIVSWHEAGYALRQDRCKTRSSAPSGFCHGWASCTDAVLQGTGHKSFSSAPTDAHRLKLLVERCEEGVKTRSELVPRCCGTTS